MWQLIGWLLIMVALANTNAKLNKLCEAHAVVCVEEKSR